MISNTKTFPFPIVKWNELKNWDVFSRIIFVILVSSSILYLAFLIYFSTKTYFSRDDFPLLVDSFHFFKSIIEPIGSHFRPIGRIHFGFHHLIGFSPSLFNMINVILHIISSVLLFKVARKYFSVKVSLFSSLIFFNLYSYNEILYWISSIQLQYCLVFSLLSILYYQRNKTIPAIIFLILASQSYELWLVLPAYFLLSKKKIISVIVTSFLLIIFNFSIIKFLTISISSYGGLPEIINIPNRIIYFVYKQLSPFSYPGIFPSIVIFIIFIIASVVFYKYFREKAVLPLIFYFIPTLIFLLSYYIPSRFFYYPAISLSIVLAIIHDSKRAIKLFGNLLIVYIMFFSLILNYLDGNDYLNYALEHKKIVKMGNKIVQLKEGEQIRLLNCINELFPAIYNNNRTGRAKLLLNRKDAFGGLIDLKDYVQFLLYPKHLKAVPVPQSNELKIIKIGSGVFVSQYSFKVIKR